MKNSVKTILVAAMTIDGKIARSKKEITDWTSQEDKRYFKQITVKAGVVIMGRTTFNTLKNPLPHRLNIVITHDPGKYIKREAKNLLEFTDKPPKKIIDNLANRGYSTIVVSGGSTVYSLFLKAGLVDEIHLTVSPRIFGRGIPLFQNSGKYVKCELVKVDRLGDGEVLVQYKIKKNSVNFQ